MSVYANLDDGQQSQVATTLGWGEVGRMIDDLDADDYPTLIHLREFGWTEDVVSLRPELAAAASESDPNVKDVLANVLKFVDKADDDVVLIISDGMGPDSEDGGDKPSDNLGKEFNESDHPRASKSKAKTQKDDGRWITIGATADSGGDKHGGTHVRVDRSGRITTGPSNLVNRPLNNLPARPKLAGS